MATAKTAPKKNQPKAGTAVAPVRQVALPANYDEAKEARKAQFMQTIAANSGERNYIKIVNKEFEVPLSNGESQTSPEISGIIVAFTAYKSWHENGYKRGDEAPPNCFAIGDDNFDNLIPSANSPDCQAQTCGTCALNKFEKDPKGKWQAKVCKDAFKLAIVAADDPTKLMQLKISATGTKHFIDYIKSIYKLGKDFPEVITEFSFDPASDYSSVRCRMIDDVPAKAQGLIVSLTDEAVALVSQEPRLDEFEEKVAAKRLPAPKKKRA